MNFIVKNWKTSLAGVVLLVLAGLNMAGVTIPGVPMPGLDATTIAAIIGLIFAKDGNVSGS